MKIILNEGQVLKLRNTLNESKSEDTYFNTYSSALRFMRNAVEKRGYYIPDEEWDNKISLGPRKPVEGDTNKISLKLEKENVKTKKYVHVQVYNRGNEIPNNYELNFYMD